MNQHSSSGYCSWVEWTGIKQLIFSYFLSTLSTEQEQQKLSCCLIMETRNSSDSSVPLNLIHYFPPIMQAPFRLHSCDPVAASHQTCKASSRTLLILLFPYHILCAWRSMVTCSSTLKTGWRATLFLSVQWHLTTCSGLLHGPHSYCALSFSSWILFPISWP